MSAPVVRRLAVLGVGLLGGSVALAARRRGVAAQVVGSGRRREALRAARERGVVDAVAPPEDAVRGADLVVLATPVGVMAGLLGRVAGALAPGCVVTDVGSVKGAPCETLPGLLPPGVHYVGAHPMAGSHLRGVEHAREDLFEGAACAVTATPGSDPEAVARAVAFWEALGARVVQRGPEAHDREVAWVSHVPHALAFAFARAFAAAPPTAGELAGGGFHDFTRIARSEAEMWSDILTANRKAVVGPLQQVGEALAGLARAIEEDDGEAVERFVALGRSALQAVSPARRASGGESPEIQAVRKDGRPEGSSKKIA